MKKKVKRVDGENGSWREGGRERCTQVISKTGRKMWKKGKPVDQTLFSAEGAIRTSESTCQEKIK